MSRYLAPILITCCMVLVISCSKREKSDPNAEEWINIEAMADDAEIVPATPISNTPVSTVSGKSEPVGDFDGFRQRLEEMKSIERKPGQTMLTGEGLVLDYQARLVQMDGDVLVDDDEGQLRAETLTGRFSSLNQIEHIEAAGGITIVSGNRTARADAAVYNYLDSTVELNGQATISEGGNSLSGESVRFWIKGDRRMICEPNAVLVVSGQSGIGMGGIPEEVGATEIRANQVIYDESIHRVDLEGNVRLRNARIAMNCGATHLYLKDDNKIDWIEAIDGVIIQSDDRKALADRAVYEADEGKFTLEGRPMVKQGRSVMTGDRIRFWHETGAVLCEPNGHILYYYDLDEETQARFPKDLND